MSRVLGVVRRIDELGRVVIPKELRRMCDIKEYDALSITVVDDGEGTPSLSITKHESNLERDFHRVANLITDELWQSGKKSELQEANALIDKLSEILKNRA